MLSIILFDVDGTLILSGGAGARALDRAFLSLHGIPQAMEDVRPEGKTDPAIVREVFARRLEREPAAGEMEAVFAAYVPFLEEEVAASTGFSVMPGIPRLLEILAGRRDVLLGLVTGNLEPAARIKLARPGLERHFRFGGFGSDSESREILTRIGVSRGRDLAVRAGLARASDDGASLRVVIVGDTLHDIRAARHVGGFCVAVATGFTPYEVLSEHGPDLLLRDLSEPERFVSALEGAA